MNINDERIHIWARLTILVIVPSVTCQKSPKMKLMYRVIGPYFLTSDPSGYHHLNLPPPDRIILRYIKNAQPRLKLMGGMGYIYLKRHI